MARQSKSRNDINVYEIHPDPQSLEQQPLAQAMLAAEAPIRAPGKLDPLTEHRLLRRNSCNSPVRLGLLK
ncbi:uncharacterized protein BO80DRAFT_445067 [Aspergillus ibericus CBS 121593]|uniref:Uncharacterized protein n=1 Tax=Aspergillus ibericus CBS 121593 TaxID=1448316 RepID=A0A395GZG2_9EURO|nr:hypothetical protein BO80DRAFT_445067 [Aspergillus ibericus CBS 121593]RAL00750.1 hypothetical protein BO80DRAFT_445067 [Aspergillus ibericus CBS 121593]